MKELRTKRKRFACARLGTSILVLIILAMPALKTVHAQYLWDEGTKVTLSETSNTGPALAYHAASNKIFMAYTAKDSCLCEHLTWSSDMLTWSSDFATGFATTSPGISPSLVYDSSNQKIYMAWENLILTCNCGAVNDWQWFMFVASSSDGQTWSNPVQVETGTGTNSFWDGLSIAFNSPSNLLVVAMNDGSNNDFISTSTDGGVNWSNLQQMYYNNSPLVWVYPSITYINGVYFLTSGTSFCILQSTNLSSWSESCPPNQSSNGSPPIAYVPAEALYHMTYKGTNSGNNIWDTTSSNAVNWNCCFQLSESSYSDTALAYNPISSSLLLAWTGTDGCVGTCGGHLNVMQYHSGSSGGGGATIGCRCIPK